MKKIIAILTAVSVTMALAVSLGGCTNHSSGSEASAPFSQATTGGKDVVRQRVPVIDRGAPTAETLLAAVGGYGGPVPSPTNEHAVEKAYAAVKYSEALPVNDLETCMAAAALTDNSVALRGNSFWTSAVTGVSPDSAYPDTAFAAMLDPAGYSKAKASGNTFDMSDINKSVQSKIKIFIRNINKRNLQYVSYDDPSGTDTILQYQHQYDGDATSKMGFIVNDEYALVHTAPIYRKAGVKTTCVLFIAGQENYTFVPVADETIARNINALVVAKEVHPRYILQPLFWQYGGDKTSVEVNGILAKLQLVGPNGAVLAETSFNAGVPPQN